MIIQTSRFRWARRALVSLFITTSLAVSSIHAQHPAAPSATQPERTFFVKNEVALASLISLSDGHLQKMADSLHLLAGTEAIRSAQWSRIQDPLADAAARNAPALNWFALPDGAYWSVQNGKETGNLSTRAYFPRVLAGQTIIGELVVSTATKKPVAIVAVPIFGKDRTVVGVLGASVYLDKLSETISREMALDDTMIFFSFDHTPLVGLDWDPHLIFIEPMKTDEHDLIRAFREMLAKDAGVVRYQFRGRERTVMFRKSTVSAWWYAFGIVPEGRERQQPLQAAPR